jgi:hypothetical protein
VGCVDPHAKVSGRGIRRLRRQGVAVTSSRRIVDGSIAASFRFANAGVPTSP